jgi:hypothetical protein
MALCGPETFGAIPTNIRWNAVRGDTATLLVEFFESDEQTYVDTDDWEFVATAYDQSTATIYELEVSVEDGAATIIAEPDITNAWGTGVGQRVAELSFDLQVTIGDVVWTPVIGIISVAGDISGGNL